MNGHVLVMLVALLSPTPSFAAEAPAATPATKVMVKPPDMRMHIRGPLTDSQVKELVDSFRKFNPNARVEHVKTKDGGITITVTRP